MSLASGNLASLDGLAQAALIRRGDLTPQELVEAAVQRIEQRDAQLNAVTIRLFNSARATIQQPLADGPFTGVPFLFKDAGSSRQGDPSYLGTRALLDIDHRTASGSSLADRVERAGFVTLGKTNVPEFANHLTTQPRAFGPTRNPWDPSSSAGGSSGGSAAAVAAGLVPIAHATDAGGSIRIPAAWCGVVGLKPSRGRTSLPADSAISAVLSEHVITRSVRDTAATLDAFHGATPGDLFVAPSPQRAYLAEVGRDPGRLRIGLQTTSPNASVSRDVANATESAARLLESLGHHIETDHPDQPREDPASWPPSSAALEFRRRLAWLSQVVGREIAEEDVEPWTWAFTAPGREITGEDIHTAQRGIQAYTQRTAAWWGNFDLLLTPTVGRPPLPLEALDPDVEVTTAIERVMELGCFRLLPNLTGQPAISLPTEWTPDGIPLGIQLVAAPYREDLLIQVAAQLEEARPWSHRYPAN